MRSKFQAKELIKSKGDVMKLKGKLTQKRHYLNRLIKAMQDAKVIDSPDSSSYRNSSRGSSANTPTRNMLTPLESSRPISGNKSEGSIFSVSVTSEDLKN